MLPNSQPPVLEQTVPSANDLLFMSEYPGWPQSLQSPLVSRTQVPHPSWYYSDPRGHIRRRCPNHVARLGKTQISRSAGLASSHFLSCPRGRLGGSELELLAHQS